MLEGFLTLSMTCEMLLLSLLLFCYVDKMGLHLRNKKGS